MSLEVEVVRSVVSPSVGVAVGVSVSVGVSGTPLVGESGQVGGLHGGDVGGVSEVARGEDGRNVVSVAVGVAVDSRGVVVAVSVAVGVVSVGGVSHGGQVGTLGGGYGRGVGQVARGEHHGAMSGVSMTSQTVTGPSMSSQPMTGPSVSSPSVSSPTVSSPVLSSPVR